MAWLNHSIPPAGLLQWRVKTSFDLKHETVCSHIAESYLATHVAIKDVIYDVHDPVKIALQHINLTAARAKELADVFSKQSVLFSGRIGCYTRRKFHIN